MKLINIQGLTQSKMIELEELIDEHSIVFLTETQQKRKTVRLSEVNRQISKMRELNDKKGGGLCILWKEQEHVSLQEINTTHSDLLVVRARFRGMDFVAVLVYFSTGANAGERNEALENEVRNIIEANSGAQLIILGDFNGHVGFIGPQLLDESGKRIIDLMEDYNLKMLNMEEGCRQMSTWQRGEQTSTIDFILCNEQMYRNFRSMEIDEDGEVINCSDHNLLSATFVYRKGNSQSDSRKECVSYFKMTKENVDNYIRKVEDRLLTMEEVSFENFDEIVRETAEECMRVTYTRNISNLTGKSVEPLWFNNNIKKEISKRRSINKLRRKSKNEAEKQRYYDQYIVQKKKVQDLVREAIDTYEKNLTERIMADGNRSKNVWKHIRELKGGSQGVEDNNFIYDEFGNKMEHEETCEAMETFWRTIYQCRGNRIVEEWNDERKHEYIQSWTADVGENANYMRKVVITKDDIREQLKKTKKKKAPGPDNLKPDLYIALLDSDICLEAMTEALNRIIEVGNVPHNWKESTTVMIEKKRKPTVKDLRPIALMNSSYKLFMGIVRRKIEEHLHENSLVCELQSGSMSNRRATDNLFILRYCVEQAFKRKKPMYVVSIDFRKAFDSIDRGKLISILMEYKVDPFTVGLIAEIYVGDKTKIKFGGTNILDIEITSGIRQGCNGSTTLFLLVTYHIIKQIQLKLHGFQTDSQRIHCLFYVDDGLIMAESKIHAENSIDLLEEVAMNCGLSMNKDKCTYMVWNQKWTGTKDIRGIEESKEMKYLGVVINNSKQCFSTHVEQALNKARRMIAVLYSVLGSCCNRLLIGKTFWKGLALSSFMYGSDIIIYGGNTIGKLQSMDNQAYRHILNVPKYTAACGMRSEVGASSALARDMKSKILYMKHGLSQEGSSVLREVMWNDYSEGRSVWAKTLKSYMEKLDLNIEDVVNLKKSQLKSRIKEYDTKEWLKEMEEKSTMSIYRKLKCGIEEERWFDNTIDAGIVMKARLNVLKVMTRNFSEGEERNCKMCDEEETLLHFLLCCNAYNDIRQRCSVLQRPYEEDLTRTIGRLLLFVDEGEKSRLECMKTVGEMWKRRARLMA